MTTSAVIPINKEIHDSENYAFLREEGMKYIEQLSSDFWTDFNIHDPGITFLEALCYAITDLGCRTSLPMKDLLAKKGMNYSEPIPPLFTARNILTNNPLTITDYRKMLVDIKGVKNAWLEIADCQEVDFYADCKKSKLKYFALDYKIDPVKKQNEVEQAIDDFVRHHRFLTEQIQNSLLAIIAPGNHRRYGEQPGSDGHHDHSQARYHRIKGVGCQ